MSGLNLNFILGNNESHAVTIGGKASQGEMDVGQAKFLLSSKLVTRG